MLISKLKYGVRKALYGNLAKGSRITPTVVKLLEINEAGPKVTESGLDQIIGDNKCIMFFGYPSKMGRSNIYGMDSFSVDRKESIRQIQIKYNCQRVLSISPLLIPDIISYYLTQGVHYVSHEGEEINKSRRNDISFISDYRLELFNTFNMELNSYVIYDGGRVIYNSKQIKYLISSIGTVFLFIFLVHGYLWFTFPNESVWKYPPLKSIGIAYIKKQLNLIKQQEANQ